MARGARGAAGTSRSPRRKPVGGRPHPGKPTRNPAATRGAPVLVQEVDVLVASNSATSARGRA